MLQGIMVEQDLESLYKIQYGMYIITTTFRDVLNGQIVTDVFQVSSNPIRFAVCVSKDTYTHELICKSRVVGVSVLSELAPTQFIGNFGYRCGRVRDKFCEVSYRTKTNGCPLVTDYALVIMEGVVWQTLDIGTHTLFVVDLQSVERVSDGVAMTYEYYHKVRKGKSTANAPTFVSKGAVAI